MKFTPSSVNAAVSKIGAIVAASLALAACRHAEAPGSQYQTVPVQKGDITQLVTASGTLSALVSVDVGSQISGRIQTLSVDFNSAVKKGDIVAEIEPAIYQAVVDQSTGELDNAKAALQLAILTAQRKRDLVERKAGTQADLDKAEAELSQSKATVTIKQAQLERARADLNHCMIEAPVDGIVISRKVDVGQTVAAAMTTPVLYTIAQDITKMHIVASVSEADIGQVAPGQNVDFSVDAFPDDVFHGKVSQVRKAATTTNNVVTYDTVIDVENPDQKLFPGMTAEVSIYVAERHGVLTVPNGALRFAPPENAKFEQGSATTGKAARGKRTVYLPASGGTLKVVSARTGATDGINSEVLEGLQEGDRVVVATMPDKKGGGPRRPSPTMSAEAAPPVIHLTNVTKTYRSGEVEVQAVRGVSLDIARGEFVAIMGASGSGKSTLMNTLGCLDRPTTGQYLLDGVNIGDLSRSQLATLRNRKLGFVFQSFNLLARTTALENVELPMFYSHPLISLRTQRRRAKQALERVGLGERLDHRPSQLSGGQQQRLAIARALVNEPELILADEPTGNLDSRTSIEIMGLFQELNEAGISIVMVTHEEDIAAYCKRIIMMRDGSVLSDERNENRRRAQDELSQMNAGTSAVTLGDS